MINFYSQYKSQLHFTDGFVQLFVGISIVHRVPCTVYRAPFTVYHITLFLLLPLLGFSQQLSQRGPFEESSFIWNPAMTASWNYWEMGVNYRQEWIGFEDAPRTSTIQMQYPFDGENMSLGGYFINDDASPITLNTAGVSYAYRLPLGRGRSGSQLAIGLNATLTQINFNTLKAVITDPDDNLLPGGAQNRISPNIGFGIFYTSYSGGDFDENFVFAGAAVNQVLPLSVPLDEFGGMADLERTFHGNAILGTRIIEDDLFIQPSIWINYSQANIIDANLSVKMEQLETFWIGLNYATSQTLGFQGGAIVQNNFTRDGTMRIGTAATYNIGQFGKVRGLGFEFYMAYRFEL